MSFAERNGFEIPKSLQINNIDQALRNRLFNFMSNVLTSELDSTMAYDYILDKLGYVVVHNITMYNTFNNRFLGTVAESKWHDPYTIIELFLQYKARNYDCENCNSCSNIRCMGFQSMNLFHSSVNQLLEEEKSGYRLINRIFVPISDNVEISEITECITTDISAAGTHIKKALELYSDRENPDYDNSIKESISAVEAMCCYITNLSGASATLGNTLKKLSDHGIEIHPAMRDSFIKLYGYTSDSGGIRHGSIEFHNAPEEDAKYMLVSCSAFVNYLKQKYCKLGGAV